MDTQGTQTSISPSLSVTPIETWDYRTESVLMEDYRTHHFGIAASDKQKIHFDDDVARSLDLGSQLNGAGFHLKGKIMHGALIRDLAVNFLLFNSIANLLGIANTHMAMDQGGCYTKFLTPVYPSESVYVQYNLMRKGERHVGQFPVRPKGTFPINTQYAVFTTRDDLAVEVFRGTHDAQAVYIRLRG